MSLRLTAYVKSLEEAGVDPKMALAQGAALEQLIDKDSIAESTVDLKTKYAAYIAIYCNIDTILWRNMSTVMAVTVLLFAIMGTLVTKPDAALDPLNHRQTIAACLVVIGFFYLGSWWNFKRMRFHFNRMGNELRVLEPSGYFHFRSNEVPKTWTEDASWITRGVLALAVLAFLLAAYHCFVLKDRTSGSRNSSLGCPADDLSL